jgi:CRISPR-associated exonuclease Cas4
MCLEEMLGVTIAAGAIFYGKTRRRLDVAFNEALRRNTEEVAKKTHELIEAGVTPKAAYSAKCDSCSLFEICLPKTLEKRQSVENYLKHALDD